MLTNKKIILAVTGSIAAYKTPELVRQLVKQGAEVQVLMTRAAADFVSPLSLSTVSKNSVYSSVSDNDQWHNHVHLGRWADVMLVAPCSANSLAKMAHGLCDNIVQAVYLSATCPVLVAPAMDEDMWIHPSTQANVQKIQSYGNTIIEPEHGELASGIIGAGRMADPERIVQFVAGFLAQKAEKHALSIYKKALITAGPTYEKLDPVRFIGNYSSGKMGIALAQNLAQQGVAVTLVLGPTKETVSMPGITVVKVESAQQMYAQCEAVFEEMDLVIMSAAVADFRPAEQAKEKIKKKENSDHMTLELVKNPDILATLGQKKTKQVIVGFALETNNELEHAQAKLVKKNADFIVLNSLNDKGAGFGTDTNKVTIISTNKPPYELPLQSKADVAREIINYISRS